MLSPPTAAPPSRLMSSVDPPPMSKNRPSRTVALSIAPMRLSWASSRPLMTWMGCQQACSSWTSASAELLQLRTAAVAKMHSSSHCMRLAMRASLASSLPALSMPSCDSSPLGVRYEARPTAALTLASSS